MYFLLQLTYIPIDIIYGSITTLNSNRTRCTRCNRANKFLFLIYYNFRIQTKAYRYPFTQLI